ncbi:methyltransferase domain-containing protein [Nitrogeniibacter mangrovi]|uniref:Malonyl-[acyl-carrier protein] O-methyltransferase n=1 Tax=Nitrogeniibacter mangrovi TaxID=2016596 RepID=A0A6C1B627_9RHOO|nr:methyltransferase domain-containing protein [Nitrogeniibacter mangrovi]QID18499.1 methyltransferase domain-containing protein [Nitrogeniibacter mangrovi]
MPDDFSLDPAHVRRQFNRAAVTYDDTDVLARATAEQMLARLEGIVHTPTHILDLGCGTGRDLAALSSRYPDARLSAIDSAGALVERIAPSGGVLSRLFKRAPRIDRIVADARALPLPPARVDMVWSNLMLNWLTDPAPALREMHRVMKVGGMLMFATLGPDTLKELRAALGAHGDAHVHPFIDMHDIGDALVGAGFGDPVMDMDVLTLTYRQFDDLIRDLRQSGSTNAASHRPRNLGQRQRWDAARAAYEHHRQEGRLPATFEIVYGHAWKPEPRTLDDGRAVIRFQPRPGAPR